MSQALTLILISIYGPLDPWTLGPLDFLLAFGLSLRLEIRDGIEPRDFFLGGVEIEDGPVPRA